MKIKNLSAGMKFLIIAVIVVAIAAAVFGVSDIFAEPTIEDLAAPYVHEIGTFKPDSTYDGTDQNVTLVAWLNTTQTIFSYDWWKDTSGDGKIDVEDVYSQDGFEQEMLLGVAIYPIFDVNPDSNYYVIAFPDYEKYNGVIVDLKIAENNDHARMQDESMYWFDRNNNNLYIHKNVIKDDIAKDYFNSIRMQTIMLVKDIEDTTKEVDVGTLFSSEIDNMHGLDTSTPNGVEAFNVKEWLTYGLRYQLVQPQDLAYVSSENLTVFVNGVETDSWSYDATTGEITIGCSPYKTTEVVVRFDALNDVSIAQKTLQWMQASDGTAVAQSVSIRDVLDEQGNNIYLSQLHYEDKEPELGAFNRLGFAAYVAVKDDGTVHNLSNMFSASAESVANDIINIVESHMSDEKMMDLKEKTGHFSGHTLSAYNTKPGGNASHKYGNVVYNMWLANKEDDAQKASEHLKNAVAAAEKDLLTSVSDTVGSSLLTTSWDSWNKWDNDEKHYIYDSAGNKENIDGRYILGTWSMDFLGGKIDPTSKDHAVFDVVCAHIEAPNKEISEIMDSQGAINSGTDCLGTNATIVDIKKDADGGGGYLYVCIWSRVITGYNESIGGKSHDQRVLSFARIRYEYDGSGELIFAKTDANGQYVAGAEYAIYDNDKCTGTPVATFTTQSNSANVIQLNKGTYYIKETKAPTGYIPQGIIGPVEIVSGQSVTIKAEEPVQEYQFDLIVYDQTTEGAEHEVPVPGITFNLYQPNSSEPLKNDKGEVINYVTNKDGKISFSIPAIGDYRLVQIGTVTNYCMENNPNSKYYCDSIPVPAHPTDSQKHITGTTIVHYEQRPDVQIKSHVQDINLLDETLATIGGDIESGSLTTVEGSKYSLYATTDILLGYYKGEQVTAKAGEKLILEPGVETATATKASDGKAYIQASHVWKTVKDGKITKELQFPLRNGKYEWRLVEVKSGYYNNGAVTEVDASWDRWNKNTPYVKHIEIFDRPVKQTRQTVALTLYAKSYVNRYTEPDEMLKHDGYPIRTNAYTGFVENTESAFASTEPIPTWMKPIDKQWTKTITSNTSTVTGTSIETATLYKNGSAMMSVKTSGLVPNSIYELVNLGDIVDIDTGKIIPAGTTLGYHMTDENGCVIINQLGSELIENPNKETSKEEYIDPITHATKNGTKLDGALPNGRYALVLNVPADGHEREVMSSDLVMKVIWRESTATSDQIAQEAISLIHKIPPDNPPEPEIPVAPSPIPDDPDAPGGPNDPYDPDHPDPGDPDDSKDIPRVDIDWVDKNKNNIAYRVVDSDNLTDAGLNEVTDKLPTTFAFYLGNDLIVDGEYEFEHKLSFYYEIDKDEYDRVINAVGYDKASREVLKHGQIYLRRFEYGEFSGGELLTDNIVINELSDGYVLGHGYDRINENATLSAAIYNDEWLNEKLSQKEDGTYRIYVIVDSSMTYKIPFSGEIVTQYFTSFKFGVLTIKSRELTPLD